LGNSERCVLNLNLNLNLNRPAQNKRKIRITIKKMRTEITLRVNRVD